MCLAPLKRSRAGNFEGRLQSDGYSAYDRVGGPKIVHAACWAHARRKFFDAVKLNPADQTSIRIVAQTDELSAIDAQNPPSKPKIFTHKTARASYVRVMPDFFLCAVKPFFACQPCNVGAHRRNIFNGMLPAVS